MLFSSRQKLQDKVVESFVKNNKNCRRKLLLEAIGGTHAQEGRQRCCDLCAPSVLAGLRLDIMKPGRTSTKSKKSPEELDEQLKTSLKTLTTVNVDNRLEADRAAFLIDNPDFLMIDSSFFCPDSTLNELCTDICFTNKDSGRLDRVWHTHRN